jgi:oxygen-independent coproporphyrinogen III oxidase
VAAAPHEAPFPGDLTSPGASPSRDGPMRLWARPSTPPAVSSVYVHAPFCARRCLYCDFAVTVVREVDLGGWLGALARELEILAAEGSFPLAPSLATLFVGGGTPSFLGPGAMDGLAGVLGRERLKGEELEWTAEANPESFTEGVARGWRRAGVNRVSLGAQSFDPRVLRWMGRLHGPMDVERAVTLGRGQGFQNLSLDLMFGLPPSLARDWASDLDRALVLGVPHLSLYGLTAEAGTPLGRAVGAGKLVLPSEEAYREEFLEASRRLVAEGYVHYEVSNFALPGFEARHNLVYWAQAPYLGLGNGAHSHRPFLRRWNLKDWAAYQSEVSAGRAPWGAGERLGEREILLERIWLGLRTAAGISLEDLGAEARGLARQWVLDGLATEGVGALALEPEGWLILDHLVLALDAAVEKDGPGGGRAPANPGAEPSAAGPMG